ncbi:MAG: NUDIX domain-containing protein [Candidatus Parcubacteria bacterium]|nr:NUDIX domain-containing protein [Candidatus Parcubacteria bacterium]
MEITRHFTATTFIVHQNKVLLHLHKKLNIWIPVGGHIDRDELPQETAVREIKEESGLDVILFNPDKQVAMGDVRQLIRPMYILLENINQFHQHIDFMYFAQADTFELSPQNNETNNLKWFTSEEVIKLEGAPENAKKLSVEAIKLLSNSIQK